MSPVPGPPLGRNHSRESVPHSVVHMQFGLDAGGSKRAMETDRAAEQKISRTGGEHRRRESLAEVRVHGRNQRMVQRFPTSVRLRGIPHDLVARHGRVHALVRFVAVTDLREVTPWRVHHRRRGQRKPLVARCQNQRGGERSTGRGPKDRDLLRRVVVQQFSIDRHPVVDGCRKGVVRQHPIVDRDDPVSGARRPDGFHHAQVAPKHRKAAAVNVE